MDLSSDQINELTANLSKTKVYFCHAKNNSSLGLHMFLILFCV